jgi:hypothetical protein
VPGIVTYVLVYGTCLKHMAPRSASQPLTLIIMPVPRQTKSTGSNRRSTSPPLTPLVCLCARWQTKAQAQKAIDDAANVELQGRRLTVGPSDDNRRLRISGIETAWTRDEVRTFLEQSAGKLKGLVGVELPEDPAAPTK